MNRSFFQDDEERGVQPVRDRMDSRRDHVDPRERTPHDTSERPTRHAPNLGGGYGGGNFGRDADPLGSHGGYSADEVYEGGRAFRAPRDDRRVTTRRAAQPAQPWDTRGDPGGAWEAGRISGRFFSGDRHSNASGRFGWSSEQDALGRPSWDASRDAASHLPNRHWTTSAGPRVLPKGYKRTDDRIRDDVCERLYAMEDIDVGDVDVQVKDGTVELQGSVRERWMKHRIEDLVAASMGVDDVDNRLRVQRGAQAPRDPAIAATWRDETSPTELRQPTATADDTVKASTPDKP